MKICSGYSEWSLRSQLQTIFITSYILIIILYVVMTVLQLRWIESYLDSNSYSVLKDNLIDQLKIISQSQILHTVSSFQVLQELVLFRAAMAEVTLGFSNISYPYFDEGIPLDSRALNLDTKNYSYAYHSKYDTLSNESLGVVSRMAGMNPILEGFFNENLFKIYEGFYTDEILNFCPAEYFDDTSFSPLNREWFYRAADDPSGIIVTEPYFDYISEQLIVTVSKAIMKGDSVYGVSAADITVVEFSKKLNKVRITDAGRIMLISAGGIIMNPHPLWPILSLYRVYNKSLTGISYSEWQKIKNLDYGNNFEMTIKDFGPCFINFETIETTANTASYYVFSIIQKSQIEYPTDDLNESFNKIYTVLFWCVIIISSVFLVISVIIIYYFAQITTKKFSQINNIFISIINRACFQCITKNCSFEEIEKNDSGVKFFVDNCKHRVNSLRDKEEKFKYFEWNLTRPSNEMLHSKWKRKIYPFNRMSEKTHNWNRAIEEIAKIVG